MLIRYGDKSEVTVSCVDDKLYVCFDGETYTHPQAAEVPDINTTVEKIFLDKDLLPPGEWSRYGFFIGPFYFGMKCDKNYDCSFEIISTVTILSEIIGKRR